MTNLINSGFVSKLANHFVTWLNLLLILGVAGCNGLHSTGVEGKVVRIDGSPVVGARVLLRNVESGKNLYQTSDSKGGFKFREGVEPGTYAIGIIEDRGDLERPNQPTVAAKYRDPSTSGLSVEVVKGESKELNLSLAPR